MSIAGQLIGPYRLLAPLGKGAMGEVWRARDERLQRFVAIKMLPAADAADPVRRERMLREAKASAAVPHANVVTLYDILSEDDRDYLVMELVEGDTLSDRIRAVALPLEVALSTVIGVADAMAVAHDKGILHRDLKSSNVMIGHDGTVKVLDFGLAKLRAHAGPEPAEATQIPTRPSKAMAVALDETMDSESLGDRGSHDVTRVGDMFGTPMYMSPEQVSGGVPDERSEVFALGVIAYELIARKPPFIADNMPALFEKIVHDEPAPLAAPADVRAIIHRALHKSPEQRQPSMAAFADELRAAQTALTAPKRARWPWLVAGLATVALAVGATAWLASSAPTPTGQTAAPERPGDKYVRRALEEYDLFYTDKALASLRAAIKVDPTHPLPRAYMTLFGAAAPTVRGAPEGVPGGGLRTVATRDARERALVNAALALATEGPGAARTALLAADPTPDRELAFWAAELAYRARDYATAGSGFRALLESNAAAFRGRIYDHYSAVLLYHHKTREAVDIGRQYAEAFPGEADALGVYATTLAAVGRLDEALRYAEEARALNEGEDTLAGLAKVHALRGELSRARELYRQSADRAHPGRRVLRLAALGVLWIVDGNVSEARAAVAPCLPNGADASVPERGACLWVAGLVYPEHLDVILADLDELAAAGTPLHPAYGFPAALANLLRARRIHDGGGCLVAPPTPPAISAADRHRALALLNDSSDFFAAYHVPFFDIYAPCQRADLAGDTAVLRALLDAHPVHGLLLLALAERDPSSRAALLDRFAVGWPSVESATLAARAGR